MDVGELRLCCVATYIPVGYSESRTPMFGWTSFQVNGRAHEGLCFCFFFSDLTVSYIDWLDGPYRK